MLRGNWKVVAMIAGVFAVLAAAAFVVGFGWQQCWSKPVGEMPGWCLLMK